MPIGVGWAGTLDVTLATGPTLRDTLLLNLLPAEALPAVDPAADLPAWERDPDGPAASGRAPTGPADTATWPTRRIRLVGQADTGITGVLVCNGDPADPGNQQDREPSSTWKRHPGQQRKRKTAVVHMPRRSRPDQPLWQQLAWLLPAADPQPDTNGIPERIAPPALTWLGTAVQAGALPADYPIHLWHPAVAYGTQLSVIDDIAEDTLTIPAGLLTNDGPGAVVATTIDHLREMVAAYTRLAGNLAAAAGGPTDGPAARADEDARDALGTTVRTWLHHADTDPTAVLVDARRILLELGRTRVDHAPAAALRGRAVNGRLVNAASVERKFEQDLHRIGDETSRSALAEL
jgi:CRISPR system Cascade subunit CasA